MISVITFDAMNKNPCSFSLNGNKHNEKKEFYGRNGESFINKLKHISSKSPWVKKYLAMDKLLKLNKSYNE